MYGTTRLSESSQYAIRMHDNVNKSYLLGNTFNGSTLKQGAAHMVFNDVDELNFTDNNFSSDMNVLQVSSSTDVVSVNNTYTTNGSVEFVSVSGLTVYGDAYSRLLSVDGATNLFIDNITSVNVTVKDVTLSGFDKNNTINNSDIDNVLSIGPGEDVDVLYSSMEIFNVSSVDYLNARFLDINTTAILNGVYGTHFRNNDIFDSNETAYNFTNVDAVNIVYNTLRRNAGGIVLQGDSDGNRLTQNWVVDNGYGLYVYDSDSNNITDNYFENIDNVGTGTNDWDRGTVICTEGPNIVGGPCIGGNFYSDYYGLDNGANGGLEGDGIGDQPQRYNVDSNTFDYYPLMLYVSRVYYAPDDSSTASLTDVASVTGDLEDGEVVPNQWQYITYSSSYPIWRFRSLFNETDFNAGSLTLSK